MKIFEPERDSSKSRMRGNGKLASRVTKLIGRGSMQIRQSYTCPEVSFFGAIKCALVVA